MKYLSGSYKDRLYLLAPIAVALILILSSVVHKAIIGVSVFKPLGYIAPLVTGALSGLLIAYWFLRSQRYLVKATEGVRALEQLNHRHEMLLQSVGDGIYGRRHTDYCRGCRG